MFKVNINATKENILAAYKKQEIQSKRLETVLESIGENTEVFAICAVAQMLRTEVVFT